MSDASGSVNLSKPLYEGMIKSMEQESKIQETTETISTVEKGKGKNKKKDKHEQNTVSNLLLLLLLLFCSYTTCFSVIVIETIQF